MPDALIGHTGFVGGTLAGQHAFAAQFNRSTIDTIGEGSFDTVVCAAAPGSMFVANRQPEVDRARIEQLIERLDRVQARRLVLISSIAVLADFAAGDDESTTSFQQQLAYGRHRRLLEEFCEQRFTDCLVVRLPALFGPGLKKNFLFDLVNPVPAMLTPARFETLLERLAPPLADRLPDLYRPDPASGMLQLDRTTLNASAYRASLEAALGEAGMTAVQFHNPGTRYQYYDMRRLWSDIAIATDAGLRHVHLVTEPLGAAAIHARLLGAPMPETDARLHREDMRTAHAALWGHSGPYLEDAASVLDKLAAFYAAERAHV